MSRCSCASTQSLNLRLWWPQSHKLATLFEWTFFSKPRTSRGAAGHNALRERERERETDKQNLWLNLKHRVAHGCTRQVSTRVTSDFKETTTGCYTIKYLQRYSPKSPANALTHPALIPRLIFFHATRIIRLHSFFIVCENSKDILACKAFFDTFVIFRPAANISSLSGYHFTPCLSAELHDGQEYILCKQR